jgi:hypothetical protein
VQASAKQGSSDRPRRNMIRRMGFLPATMMFEGDYHTAASVAPPILPD